MLPQDLLKWKTVYYYFRAWRLDGTWEKVHEQCVQWERVVQGHEPVPSAASLDSQSVNTATPSGLAVGYDGGEKPRGVSVT